MFANAFYWFDKTEEVYFMGDITGEKRKSFKNNTRICPEFGKEGYQ